MQKASSLLHCLAGTLEQDLVGHRKGAIAKAFLARKPGEPPSVARFVGKNLKPKEYRIKSRTEISQKIHGADVAKRSQMSSAAIAKEWRDAHDGENPLMDYVARETMERAGQRLGVTPTPQDAPRVELPPEFRSALERLHELFVGALGDARLNSCWSAWADIKRTKNAKKKIEIFNAKSWQWRERSAEAIREWLPKFVDLATRLSRSYPRSYSLG